MQNQRQLGLCCCVGILDALITIIMQQITQFDRRTLFLSFFQTTSDCKVSKFKKTEHVLWEHVFLVWQSNFGLCHWSHLSVCCKGLCSSGSHTGSWQTPNANHPLVAFRLQAKLDSNQIQFKTELHVNAVSTTKKPSWFQSGWAKNPTLARCLNNDLNEAPRWVLPFSFSAS